MDNTLFVNIIAPVMTATHTNKDDKKAKELNRKTKAKRPEKEAVHEEEYAATYNHDPYAELNGITYKRPRIKGY